MADYIDREDLLADIEEGLKKSPWYGKEWLALPKYESEYGIRCVDDVHQIRREAISVVEELFIKRVPTANVAPVEHGNWIEYPRAHYFKCSKCKYTVPYRKAFLHNWGREYNYCPHCGSRMGSECDNG